MLSTECNYKLNFMTRNLNSVNKDYELKTQYFMSQMIKKLVRPLYWRFHKISMVYI